MAIQGQWTPVWLMDVTQCGTQIQCDTIMFILYAKRDGGKKLDVYTRLHQMRHINLFHDIPFVILRSKNRGIVPYLNSLIYQRSRSFFYCDLLPDPCHYD